MAEAGKLAEEKAKFLLHPANNLTANKLVCL